MTTEVTTTENRNDVIKRMYLKNCTDAEIEVFFAVANTYGLDPVKKEIYPQKFGGQMQPIVTRDGLLAIAHRSGKFLGMKTDILWEDGKIGQKEGCLGATCRIKTLSPNDDVAEWEETVWRSEYDKKQNLWLTLPITMIQKVAEAHCLRKAFTVSGVYLSEEMPEPDLAPIDITPQTQELHEKSEFPDVLTLDTLPTYRQKASARGIPDDFVKGLLEKAKIEPGKWDRSILDSALIDYMISHPVGKSQSVEV